MEDSPLLLCLDLWVGMMGGLPGMAPCKRIQDITTPVGLLNETISPLEKTLRRKNQTFVGRERDVREPRSDSSICPRLGLSALSAPR